MEMRREEPEALEFDFLKGPRSRRKQRGINGNMLKLIAVLAMACDHAAWILIRGGKLYGYDPTLFEIASATEEGKKWMIAYHVLRTIGRIAFPIFAFLLAEGFIHTRNLPRYCMRMLALALISEVPYNLAMSGQLRYDQTQNICFTFFTALLCLYAIRKSQTVFIAVPAVAAGCAVSWFLKMDYAVIGILMPVIFFYYRKEKKKACIWGGVLAAVESVQRFGAAVLALIPICFYNGERGERKVGTLFYLFYPAHLIVFYLLVYLGTLIY